MPTTALAPRGSPDQAHDARLDVKIPTHTTAHELNGQAETMQAIVQDKYGSADVLQLRDVEKPAIRVEDVLVRVRAAGVHIGDWHLKPTGKEKTMKNQIQTTVQDRDGPHSYRKTAITVGVIYLLGMVVGIGGNIVIQSILGASDPLASVGANSMLVAIGALLWLTAVAGDAAHGILMFPVLKRFSERIASGYFGARIMDAIFVGIMALLILFQIPLANEYLKGGASETLQALSAVFTQAQLYAYHLGMLTVGVAGLMLCYLFFKTRLVPRFLGVWGLVGYAVILGGSVLEVLGFNLNSIHTIPGGLWELFIGVWQIVRGFSASTVPPERTTSRTTRIVPSPAVGSATA
jgi:hypothetical protein